MVDLRCYICGEQLGDTFRIMAMQKDVDRVFVTHTGNCAAKVDDLEVDITVTTNDVMERIQGIAADALPHPDVDGVQEKALDDIWELATQCL